MGAAFVLLVAGHEVAAMIADEDEDCVVGELFLFEDTADTPHRGVDCFNATVVVRQLRLPRNHWGEGEPVAHRYKDYILMPGHCIWANYESARLTVSNMIESLDKMCR